MNFWRAVLHMDKLLIEEQERWDTTNKSSCWRAIKRNFTGPRVILNQFLNRRLKRNVQNLFYHHHKYRIKKWKKSSRLDKQQILFANSAIVIQPGFFFLAPNELFCVYSERTELLASIM